MRRLLNSITRSAPPADDLLLYIVVAQYLRPSFESPGEESEFHWAIAVVEDLDEASTTRCRCYQVFNGPLPDQPAGQRQVGWHVHVHRDALLGGSGKYRGGVSIGRIRSSDIEKLDKVRIETFSLNYLAIVLSHY